MLKIFRAHFPLLAPIGTGLKTPARERDWEDVLSNKTSLWQRKDVMVGPSVCERYTLPTAELCVN